jgi:ribose transport system permease protein
VKSVAEQHQKMQKGTKSKILTLVLILIAFLICNLFAHGRFLTGNNLLSILTHAVVPSFIAWGFCFIYTTGIMDLSVGAIVILASIVGGILAFPLGYFGLIIGAVITAVVLELVNLSLIIKLKVPSWVFGLGAAMVYEAIGTYYETFEIDQGKQVVSLGNTARKLGSAPWNIIVLCIGIVISYIIFNRTTIGFDIRAIGSNHSVASMMGVKSKKAILFGGFIGSCFIGVASAINESYAGRVMPVTGLNSVALVFIPLAVYLLAQAFERIFNLTISVVISAIIIESLFNILTIFGVPSGTWQDVALGTVIIVCGILAQKNEKGIVK